MKILAIDPGSKTGWAIVEGGAIAHCVESGVQEFSLKRGESVGMRFVRFRKWLNDLLALWRPDLIVYEQAHHRGGAATELCVGFVTRILELAVVAEPSINHMSCHSMTLKKWATGKGKSDKKAMMQVAESRCVGTSTIVLDDNHADAILLGLWAYEEVN